MDYDRVNGGGLPPHPPPPPNPGYLDPPEITVLSRQSGNDNGVPNYGNSVQRQEDRNVKSEHFYAPQKTPIKITPPPPRFVQATIPPKAIPFTVLGSGTWFNKSI